MRSLALAKQHGTYLVMDIYDDECIPGGQLKGPCRQLLEHDRNSADPARELP